MAMIIKDDYGPLQEYVMDDRISDIDINNNVVWVTDTEGSRRRVDIPGIEGFIPGLCQRIANTQQQNFNRMNPLLEAEANGLRISIIHETVSMGGRSISIRKSLPKKRFTKEMAIQSGYVEKEVIDFLIECVKGHCNFVVAGEPGVGKTELCKFLASMIAKEERIITLEDNLEWHLQNIIPSGDVVELKVSRYEGEGQFSYSDAIKASLRQNPKWLMLSEARGKEARQLMEAWSTGICGMTTIHTDDTRKIPERILNMIGDYRDAERLENQIYEDIDVGILVMFYKDSMGNVKRRIEQIRLFGRCDNKNISYPIVEAGKVNKGEMPIGIRDKLKRKNISVRGMYEN